MKLLGALCLVLSLIGCKSANQGAGQSPKADTTPTATREAAPAQRFVPAGGSPEVALDTQKGTLCRTVPATPGSSDKYASLPMCGSSESSSATPIVFAWDKARHDAPLEASCYLATNLLPWYSANTPSTMRVTSGCTIQNRTEKEQPLVGSTSYDAILRGSDGKTTRRTHVNLASGETVIPAHGHIEGGLWPNADCAPNQSAADCLKSWIGDAKELILTSEITGLKAHVMMDRDSDPLGILK